MTHRNKEPGIFPASFGLQSRLSNPKESKMKSKLAEWSLAVRTRDGKCMSCGELNNLHAHHILPKSTHPELALDVENGKTLCYACHKKEHENNRMPRIRKEYRPHRKTLERRIEALEAEIAVLTATNRKLVQKVNECARGSCDGAISLMRKIFP